ncbi:MAG: protein kinase [bacterium]|nr:protein kinase [bacterium]
MGGPEEDKTGSFHLSIGRKILHYQIISLVGSGGMGKVYLARDESLDRLVAFKVLTAEYSTSSEHRKRFVNEAKASARLNHKNICSVYAIEELDDLVFISMEYVQGSTLKEIMQPEGMEVDQVADLAIQCCEGIRAAHDENVIHRDIKPANIMLDKYGTAKILDFGLAKFLDDPSMTQSSAIMGTVKYMSPEQITGKPVDGRTDIFSLGVLLYEALTGKVPFEGNNIAAIAYSLAHGDLKPIGEFRPEIPVHLAETIETALARDPDERFQTASEMLESLNQGISETAVQTPAVGLASASIAVFPFRDISIKQDSPYLADGLCDEVITCLAKIPKLSVVSRSAVARFADKEMDIIEAGRQLKVGYTVEGSLRTQGDRIRINIQLTKIANGLLVWSESYERNLNDLFSLQTDVSEQIASALNLRLGEKKEGSDITQVEVDPAAYDLYLQAKFQLKRREESALNRGIELLKQSIALDPKFASAYGELAMAIGLCSGYGYHCPYEFQGKAEELANRAIELNPGSSQAHMSLFFHYRWRDINKGISELRTSIALDSSNFEAYHFLAHGYMFTGLYETAIRAEQAALKLDPFQAMADAHLVRICFFSGHEKRMQQQLDEMDGKYSDTAVLHSTKGWLSWINRDWSSALEHYQKALRKDPANVWSISNICDCLIRLKECDKAVDLLDTSEVRNPDEALLVARRGQVALARGDMRQVRQFADLASNLEHRSAEKQDRVGSAIYYFDRAWIDSICGYTDEAAANLKQALAHGYGHYGELRLRPDWDALREESEFDRLLNNLERERKEIDQKTA